MAQFVEPDRLWALLAYFVGAVIVIVAADIAVGGEEGLMLWIVLAWLVATPLGAGVVWRKSASVIRPPPAAGPISPDAENDA